MALASCANLLPNRSRRSRSSSDEINEPSYQGNNSQFINPSSPSGGRSSASKDEPIQSTLYCLEGINGVVECTVDEDAAFEYHVFNIETGMARQIRDFSFEYTGNLDVYGELQNDKVSLLIHFVPYDSGVFDFSIEVTDIYGQSYAKSNQIVASYHNFDSDIRIDYQSSIQTMPNCGSYITFYAYNKRTGNALRFDANHPFDIGHIDESIVKINSYQTMNNGEYLELYIESQSIGADLVELKLILNNGSTYNVTVYFEVRPDIWLEQLDFPIVPYGGHVDVTFQALQNDKMRETINAHLNVDRTSFEVHRFAYEIIDFNSSTISLRFYNNENADYGDIIIRSYTEEGFYYEWGYQIISQRVYETERWINCNVESAVYQRSGKIIFGLDAYFAPAIIKDIEVTFRNGKVDDFYITNLFEYNYEYHFIPNGYGDETMHISITSEEGYVFEQEFGFYISQ